VPQEIYNDGGSMLIFQFSLYYINIFTLTELFCSSSEQVTVSLDPLVKI